MSRKVGVHTGGRRAEGIPSFPEGWKEGRDGACKGTVRREEGAGARSTVVPGACRGEEASAHAEGMKGVQNERQRGQVHAGERRGGGVFGCSLLTRAPSCCRIRVMCAAPHLGSAPAADVITCSVCASLPYLSYVRCTCVSVPARCFLHAGHFLAIFSSSFPPCHFLAIFSSHLVVSLPSPQHFHGIFFFRRLLALSSIIPL